MSSIDDLRGTLERHAENLTDHDVHIRPVAVRERVRGVRRRRRGAVAGLAAVVVAGVAITTVGLRDDSTPPVADRTLAGHVAPGTMTSLGYTFEFAQARQGDGRASLDLPRSDQPRLISWATRGNDDEVTLRGPGDGPRTTTAEDFGDFTFVYPGASGRYSVRGAGEVALAVYDLTDAVPPGDTKDGITFRDDVGGQRLLGDVIGDPGEADLSIQLAPGAGPLPVSYFCSGGPKGTWIHVSLNGQQVTFGGGCDDPLFDPGGRGNVTSRVKADDASDLHLRIWATDGEKGGVIDDPDLRIGVAAYAPAPTVTRLAGAPLPATLEYDGHVWQFVDTVLGTPGDRLLETDGLPGEETLVSMRFRRTGPVRVSTRQDGARGFTTFATGGPGGTQATIPATGGTVGLRAQEGARPDVELGLARYVRAD